MFSKEELDAFRAGGLPQIATAQPQQKKKKKNFFVDQISTAGGILGGIGGSFISPIAGTAAGAGAGSALGEALENILTGESIGKNVAKEGALGAVFGAGPLKLLKGGAALATGKGVQAASQAAMTPLRKKAGQTVLGAADDLAVKQFRLTPTQLKNFQSKFGEDAGQVIRKYGFQSADDIATKGIEPLQQQFDDAIAGITGVTKDSLQKNLMKRVNALSKAGPSDTKALGKNLKSEVNAILKGQPDVIDAKQLNTIRRQFDDLVNYTERAANPARYGVNKRMADGIRETLQQADPTGGLKQIGRELNKLRQLSDIAAKQGQLGRGSLPLNLPTLLGGGMGGAAAGPAGAIGSAAATAVVNSPTGRRAAMKGAEKLGGALAGSGTRAAGQSAKGIAGRQIAQNLMIPREQPQSLEEALDQSLANNAMSATSNPTAAPISSASMMGEQYALGGEMSSPYTRENLIADVTRDPQNAEDYFKLYQMYQEVFAAPEQKPLGAEAQKRALTAESGLRSLGTLEETLGTDPGAFQRQALPNPLGITARLTGTTDVRAATDNIIDVIARLRSGAAITDAEAARFARFLPQPGDSQESALRKLRQVRAELESFANPAPGGSSLEDALMQMQGAY